MSVLCLSLLRSLHVNVMFVIVEISACHCHVCHCSDLCMSMSCLSLLRSLRVIVMFVIVQISACQCHVCHC